MKINGVVTTVPVPYVSAKTNKSYYSVFVMDEESDPSQRCMTELEYDCGAIDPATLGLASGVKVELTIRQFVGMQNGIPRTRGYIKVTGKAAVGTPAKAA
jgi:hypothetical protein